MNEQQLKCFVKVAERLSFSRAAEELYLSVPTVSHHIQSLEKELNVVLLVRNRQSVQLSQAGEAFYPDACDLLSRMQEAEKHASDAALSSHIFRIGCTSEAEIMHLEPVLRKMHAEMPDLKPRFIVNDYARITTLLKDHQIDAALCTREMLASDSSIHFTALSQECSYAVMIKKKRKKIPADISFKELEKETLITLSTRMIPFRYGDHVQSLIQRHQENGDDIFVDTGIQAVTLVKAGYGTAIMPQFVLPPLSMDTIALRIRESDTLDYGIAWIESVISKPLELFLDTVKEMSA